MDLKATLGIIGTLGAGAWWAWVKLVKPVVIANKRKKEEFYNKMNEMHHELKFNGGTSLKDVVFKIDEKVNKIEIRLDDIDQNTKLSMNLQGIAFWISDEQGECTYASPGLCKVMGRSESEIKGNGWMGWLHPDDKQKVVDAWNFCVETHSPFDEVYRVKKSNGKWAKVWGQAFPKIRSSVFGGVLGKLVEIEEAA